jgi:HEAT repeat protein
MKYTLMMAAAAALLLTSCMGDTGQVRTETARLTSGDPTERQVAASRLALYGHQSKSAVPALIARLGKETNASVRDEIVRALGKSGDMRAVPVLKEREEAWALADIAADGANRGAERAALEALVKLSEDQEDAVRERIARVFMKKMFAHRDPAREFLRIAAADPSSDVRALAVRAIPRLMKEGGKPLLRDMLKDPDPTIAAQAAAELEKLEE